MAKFAWVSLAAAAAAVVAAAFMSTSLASASLAAAAAAVVAAAFALMYSMLMASSDVFCTGEELNSRFVHQQAFTFTYGDESEFFEGLEGLIGTPVAEFMLGMRFEHQSSAEFEAWNGVPAVKRITTPRS